MKTAQMLRKTLTGAVVALMAGMATLSGAAAHGVSRPAGETVRADIVDVHYRGDRDRRHDRRHDRRYDRRHDRGDYSRLNRRDVRRILARSGFYRAHDIRRVGRTYRATALAWGTFPVRVAVHARTGEILRVRPLRRYYRHRS